MAQIKVVFLEPPELGKRAAILLNSRPAHSSRVRIVRPDAPSPGWYRVVTASGSVYFGPLAATPPVSANTKQESYEI